MLRHIGTPRTRTTRNKNHIHKTKRQPISRLKNSPPQPTAPYASASTPCERQPPNLRPHPYTQRCSRWETPRRNPVSHPQAAAHERIPVGKQREAHLPSHRRRASPRLHALPSPTQRPGLALVHAHSRTATRRPPIVRRAQTALPRWRGRSRTPSVPGLSSNTSPASLTRTGRTSGGLRGNLRGRQPLGRTHQLTLRLAREPP